MQSRLTRLLWLRVVSLQISAGGVFLGICGIISYGFILSHDASDTTSKDVQELRASLISEENKITLRVLNVQLADAWDKLYVVYVESMPGASVGVPINDTKEMNYVGVNYCLTDQDTSNECVSSLSDRKLSKLDAEIPSECRDMRNIKLARKREDYQLSNLDRFFNFITVKINAPGDAKYLVQQNPEQSYTDDQKKYLKNSLDSALKIGCRKVLSSNEYKAFVDLISQYDSALTKTGGPTETKSDEKSSNYVYLLLVNRFGPLVIIFFFATLLLSIFKYTARLSSFYYARLYSIYAMNDAMTAENFAALVSVFSPDKLDFGRNPKSPVDIASEVAVAVASKLAPKGKEE